MDVCILRSNDHAHFPAISHQLEESEDDVQQAEAARTRPGQPVDLRSRSSSTETFDSTIFSAPGEQLSSIEASLLLGEAGPSKTPHAGFGQPLVRPLSPLAMTYGQPTKNQEQLPPSSPLLELNDDEFNEWGDVGGSGVAERPMTKTEFLDRQYEKVIGTYKKLRHLRERNLETRLRAQEMRNELQETRNVAASADEMFMKAFNAFFANNQSEEVEGLRRLYENCRTLRDDYKPLENSYNGLEDQVHQEEYELDRVERKLYVRTNRASELGESTFLTEYPSSQSSLVTEDVFIEYPSEATKYISRRGDAEIVRERLQDHRTRRAILVDTEQYRKLHHLELDDESRLFLANFDTVHENLQRELADIESNLEDLAKICVEQGLWGIIDYSELDELLQHDENMNQEDDLFLKDDDDCLKMKVMHEANELHVRELEDLPDTEPIDHTQYINSWLYRNLRTSRREILNLKNVIWWNFMVSKIVLDPRELSELVKEWWRRDEAALSSVVPKGSIRGYSTTSARSEIPSKAVSLRGEREPVFGFSASWSQV